MKFVGFGVVVVAVFLSAVVAVLPQEASAEVVCDSSDGVNCGVGCIIQQDCFDVVCYGNSVGQSACAITAESGVPLCTTSCSSNACVCRPTPGAACDDQTDCGGNPWTTTSNICTNVGTDRIGCAATCLCGCGNTFTWCRYANPAACSECMTTCGTGGEMCSSSGTPPWDFEVMGDASKDQWCRCSNNWQKDTGWCFKPKPCVGKTKAGLCHSGCGAHSSCHGIAPNTNIGNCKKGGYLEIHDKCDSNCQPVDRTGSEYKCVQSGVSDCTAISACHNKAPGQCASSTSYCNNPGEGGFSGPCRTLISCGSQTCPADSCLGVNTATLTWRDYPASCSKTCSGSSCNNCCSYSDTSWGCSAGNSCQTRSCGGTTYVCTNAGGSWAWRVSSSCDDGNACTTGDVCGGGSCSGTAMNCNDGQECTSDSCSGGSCSNTPLALGTACAGGVCNAAGSCVGCNVDADCNDGNDCTSDSCVSNSCSNAPVADGTACSGGVCSSGGCVNKCFIGGVFYDNGVLNPSNDCQRCDVSVSVSSWTNLAGGSGCNDGDACTTGDSCSGSVCSGTPVSCGSPGGPVCADGVTVRTFSLPGSCSGGSCSYSYSDSVCVDGNPCTDDSCSGGACVFSNNAVPCDDGNECTSDVCGGGSCIGTNLLEGTSCSVGYCEDGSCRTCFIGGEVYANGELNPSNACQRCDSSNPTSWTNLADGSNCGGTPGKCCAGVCDSDGLTTNDVLHGDCRNGPMCVGVGQWGFFRLAEGTPCSVNGFCEDNGGNGCVEPACFFNGEVYAASEEVSRDCDAGGQAGSACGVQTGVCNSDQSVGSWGGCFLKASSECFTGVSEPCEVGGVYGWQSCTNCFLSASCALPDTGERVNAISVECPRIVVEDSFVVKGTAIIDGIPKCVDSIVVSGPGTPVVSLSCSEPVSSADVGNVVNGSYTLTFTSGAEEKTCVVKQIVVETTTGAPDFSLLLLPAFAAIALALLRRRKVS